MFKLRKKIPGISVSTDIIVGFCGESEKDFDFGSKILDELKKPRSGEMINYDYLNNYIKNVK